MAEDIKHYVDNLTKDTVSQLSKCCPKENGKPKKAYIAEDTWQTLDMQGQTAHT